MLASFSIGPKVAPLSLLTVITGTSPVSLVSHHETTKKQRNWALLRYTSRTSLVDRVLAHLHASNP